MLLLKSIDIVKPSDNNNVSCRLVRWDQNMLPCLSFYFSYEILGCSDLGGEKKIYVYGVKG